MKSLVFEHLGIHAPIGAAGQAAPLPSKMALKRVSPKKRGPGSRVGTSAGKFKSFPNKFK